MSTRDREGSALQWQEAHQIQFRSRGRTRTALVYTPEAAFPRLATEENRATLIAQANKVVHDESAAEDIVQSSFLNAYCKLNDSRLYAIRQEKGYLLVRGGMFHFPALQKETEGQVVERWLAGVEPSGIVVIEKPFAWLQTIVQNNAYKYYNQRKRYWAFCMNPSNWALVEDPRCPDPEQVVLQVERCAEVREFVAALSPRYREIVQLRYFQDQDLSFQEIADKLHRPLSTVTAQSARAHKMIREAVQEKRIVKDGRLKLT
jgi:RNA polymerase sigma factor (sigma-70 family)